MMLLIAMAITVAFVASWATTLGIGGFDLDFWWELALLIVIMLLGHWLEMRALGAASGALDALAALLPDTAERVHGGRWRRDGPARRAARRATSCWSGPASACRPTAASSTARPSVDESMITGESRPVPQARRATAVVAGTVATDNALRVEVTAVGEATPRWPASSGWSQRPRRRQSRAQALADRAAALAVLLRRRRRRRSRSSCGRCSATRTRPSRAPSPCW